MNTNPDINIEGVAPAYQLVSDFQFAEFSNNGNKQQLVIDFQVPRTMIARKIYAWLWAQAAGNWYAKALIQFYREQSALGSLPLQIGGGTFPGSSLVTACTANGANVQDCLGVYISTPVNGQPATLVLQPLYIVGEFDRMTLSIIDASTVVASLRGLLACISSQP